MVIRPIFALSLLPLTAWATVTNRNEPCHNGVCEWDISTDTGSGVLQIVSTFSTVIWTGLSRPHRLARNRAFLT